MEIWKDIPGYENYYQASNLGRIKNIVTKVVLKGYMNRQYLAVGLWKNRTRKVFKVHQLIAMAFLGHTPSGMKLIIDHIDNKPLNNLAWNLQITSQRINATKDKLNLIGATYKKENKNWIASIRIKGIKTHLGVFKTEVDAHKAYLKVMKSL